LTEPEIAQALVGSENTQWWRAIRQILEDYRATSMVQAASSVSLNNPLAMAANNGAHAALTELFWDLEKRVAPEG
jgi:hypothetical protein